MFLQFEGGIGMIDVWIYSSAHMYKATQFALIRIV